VCQDEFIHNENLHQESSFALTSSPVRFIQPRRKNSREDDNHREDLDLTRQASTAENDGRNFRLLSPIRSNPASLCGSSPRRSPTSSDSGGSVEGRLPVTKRGRGRPSKKDDRMNSMTALDRDTAAEDSKRRDGEKGTPPPPIPILKLRIPKTLLQNEEAVSSQYRRVAVRRECLPRPPRRMAVQNQMAQKLKALHCKVDVQKFRFKVQYDD